MNRIYQSSSMQPIYTYQEQNYNSVCTNGFLQLTNNLQPPKQVIDCLFIKETLKIQIYHIPHTQKICIKGISTERDM